MSASKRRPLKRISATFTVNRPPTPFLSRLLKLKHTCSFPFVSADAMLFAGAFYDLLPPALLVGRGLFATSCLCVISYSACIAIAPGRGRRERPQDFIAVFATSTSTEDALSVGYPSDLADQSRAFVI